MAITKFLLLWLARTTLTLFVALLLYLGSYCVAWSIAVRMHTTPIRWPFYSAMPVSLQLRVTKFWTKVDPRVADAFRAVIIGCGI
jgi:hypothetical protein